VILPAAILAGIVVGLALDAVNRRLATCYRR
jgi:hypothetical protein